MFCSVCGSQLFARNAENRDQMGVRMSAFDSDPGVRPGYHQFVDYAVNWEAIPEDGLERYAEARPRPGAD